MSESLDFITNLISTIFASLSLIFSSIGFSSFMLFKSRLTTQDTIICQKCFIQFVFSGCYLCISVYNNSGTDTDKLMQYMNPKVLIVYIIAIYVMTGSINYENYISIKDPTHVFNSLIKSTKEYLIVDLFICCLVPLCIFIKRDNKNSSDSKEEIGYDISLYYGLSVSTIIISLSLLTFNIGNQINFPEMNFVSENKSPISKKNFKKNNGINTLINILYFFLSLLFLGANLENNRNIKYCNIIQLAVYSLNVIESFLFMGIVYHSSFYFYNLGPSNMGFLFSCFGCDKYYQQPIFFNENISYQTNDKNGFMINLYNNIGYIIDDYLVESFDHLLNISLSSIALSYSSFEKSKKTYNKNKTINDFNANFLNENSYFTRSNNIRVDITTLYANEIQSVLTVHQINKDSIIKSLLSHNYTSMLSKNSKDEYFKSLKNLCLKTYDKRGLIEMQSDCSINNEGLKRYFEYISDENSNSFLPIGIGVFKGKINHFNDILFFISVNPGIEDVPKERFNYWQLMRFNYSNEGNKISSSKDRDSFIITMENVFTSSIQFQLKEYNLYSDTFRQDGEFLKKGKSSDFYVLILYYEYGSKDEKPNFFKEKIEEINENNLATNFDTEINTKDIMFMPYSLNDISHKENPCDFSGTNGTKSSINKNGFDVLLNNYKGILYFAFEDIFKTRTWTNCGCIMMTNYYEKYINNLNKYFRPSNLNLSLSNILDE